MHEKRPAVLALVSVCATFCLWLTAMVTPGWFILKWESTKAPSVHKYNAYGHSLLNSNPLVHTEKTTDSIEMSIFYVTVCESQSCVQVDYDKLPKKSRNTANSLPELMEIKIESISALGLCVVGFFFLLLNFGNSSRVLTGGIIVVLAALVESILVLRMTIANIRASNALDAVESVLDSESISMEVDFPYSLILAGIGILFSAIVMWFCRALYARLRQQTTDGRVLNLFPVNTPNNFTILQESY
ncbi:uncharacterized protein LOC133194786 [Saccostrea echinata]|uniref:uncharacterized protein LOC133194786 n=1 Tax=Saccostrea echinata TaxID=191078 RepID=UPI002A8300C5|nr:uncharacterized protein LOC133194786 [Saccostrea echinata]